MAKNRYFVDFFVGYYIDNRYTYPKKGLGIGIALAYDRMITDHFGIGIDLSVYPIINMSKFGYLSADYTTLNLKTGIRYYF